MKIIYIILGLIIILLNYDSIYNKIVSLYLQIKLYFVNNEDKYLHDNFTILFKSENIININSSSFDTEYQINAHRESINQYKIIDTMKQYDLATNIVKNINQNDNIFNLLKLLLPHININGKNVDIEQCVVVDLLKSNVQSFPSIHTDIEWGIFNKSDGFQAWYLYENNEDIGNMFLFDTKMVEPSTYLVYSENKDVLLKEQCSDKIIKKLDRTEINPNIKYLNMVKGECLIFGKNLYHLSDFRKSKYRYSINFRVVIKDSDGGIPIDLSNNNCSYNTQFKFRLIKNNIKTKDNKIYPKMFDLINII